MEVTDGRGRCLVAGRDSARDQQLDLTQWWLPLRFEQPVRPETNEPARDGRQCRELEPAEVVA
jgi:hypothetical protein